MQKALTQMNIRLAEVINDISGVSGLRILDAILAGERCPQTLLDLCVDQIKAHKAELVLKSLQGQYRDEHLFALKQAVHTYRYYQALIAECDQEIEKQLEHMTAGKGEPEVHYKRKAVRYHKPAIKDLHKPLLKLGCVDSSFIGYECKQQYRQTPRNSNPSFRIAWPPADNLSACQ
jgi:hypothetical protein